MLRFKTDRNKIGRSIKRLDVIYGCFLNIDTSAESAIFADERRPNTMSYLQERVPILVDDAFTTL